MAMVLRLLGQAFSRIERLEQRLAAGQLWRVAARVVVRKAVSGEVPVVVLEQVRVERIWPCRFGWLIRQMGPMGYNGVAFGSQLRAVLERPEVVALLVEAPQIGRILLPVCRMLGVESSVLRPGVVRPVRVIVPKVAVVRKRVRKVVDWGRIPLPRGVLAAAKRHGFGKVI